jgi:hypothetical protein
VPSAPAFGAKCISMVPSASAWCKVHQHGAKCTSLWYQAHHNSISRPVAYPHVFQHPQSTCYLLCIQVMIMLSIGAYGARWQAVGYAACCSAAYIPAKCVRLHSPSSAPVAPAPPHLPINCHLYTSSLQLPTPTPCL